MKYWLQKCISVSPEQEELRKEHRLSWSEVAKIGMSMKLAELGIAPYDNRLNLVREVDTLKNTINKLQEKILEQNE